MFGVNVRYIMITSPRNNQIKQAQKLLRKKYREEQGLLLLEGVRLIRDALNSAVLPKVVYYAPERIALNPAAETLIARLRAAQVDCVSCAVKALAPLSTTKSPQGIVALVPLPRNAVAARASLILILDQIRDPGNAGALLRSAEAAGVEQVIFAPFTVDVMNDKVLRAAMGAHFRLPVATCRNWGEIIDLCDNIAPPGLQVYLATPKARSAYDTILWRDPAALIIGGEAEGASLEAQQWAKPVAIPMAGATESLNAAVAGSVILFEAARQRRGR